MHSKKNDGLERSDQDKLPRSLVIPLDKEVNLHMLAWKYNLVYMGWVTYAIFLFFSSNYTRVFYFGPVHFSTENETLKHSYSSAESLLTVLNNYLIAYPLCVLVLRSEDWTCIVAFSLFLLFLLVFFLSSPPQWLHENLVTTKVMNLNWLKYCTKKRSEGLVITYPSLYPRDVAYA